MPRPRLIVVCSASTQLALDALRTQIESDLPTAGRIYDKPVNWRAFSVPNLGRIVTKFDVRIKTVADADTVWGKWKAKLATLRATGVTGRISYHQ